MIADVECENFPLTNSQVTSLLDTSCKEMNSESDGLVAIRCVSSEEIRHLNATYRATDAPTNVLAFSYDAHEHDVALCMDIATQEAVERKADLSNYVALLLTHAFLHVLGMDHERSDEEDDHTRVLEKKILETSGFSPISLSAL